MWAVPIIIDEIHIGAIMCGQVLLWKADDFYFRELKQFNKNIEEFEVLKEKAKNLNIISATKSQSVANMLAVVVNYLVKTNNTAFLEQKNLFHWRNTIIEEIEQRKRDSESIKYDYSVYFKREKRLLQYIRMGNRDKIIDLLPAIFTDIEVLCNHEVEEVKNMSSDLLALVSRAASEAGVESEICIKFLNLFKKEIRGYKSPEKVFFGLNRVILELIDMIFMLVNDNHTSILKSVREYINNNYQNKITIDEISENVFMSTSYLCHLFKEKLNCTVNDYITRVRIEKSIELMKKRELSINDIMNLVGFSSQSHFTKTFKKIIGVTPGQYRNKFL